MKIIYLVIFLLVLSTADAIVLVEKEVYTLGTHQIMVFDVNREGTMCGVSVDGRLKWLDKSHYDYFGDVYVYVIDIITVHAVNQDKDSCELTVRGVDGHDLVPSSRSINLEDYTPKPAENKTEEVVIETPNIEEPSVPEPKKSIFDIIISWIKKWFFLE